MAQLAHNVRRQRLAAGLTQEDLSDLAGVNPRMISRIEQGAKNAQLLTLVRVSRGLGVPVAELMADVE